MITKRLRFNPDYDLKGWWYVTEVTTRKYWWIFSDVTYRALGMGREGWEFSSDISHATFNSRELALRAVREAREYDTIKGAA